MAEPELIQAVRVVAAGGTWLPGLAAAGREGVGPACARAQERPPLSPCCPSSLTGPQVQESRPPVADGPGACPEGGAGLGSRPPSAGALDGPASAVDVAGPQVLDDEELALLGLVAEALPDEQIAAALGCGAAEVASARQALAARLGCKGRISLIHYARAHALG